MTNNFMPALRKTVCNWQSGLGIACLIAGVWIWISGIPTFSSSPALNISNVREIRKNDSDFPALTSHYPVDTTWRYALQQGDMAALTLDVVDYSTATGEKRRAMLYLPNQSDLPAVQEIKKLRQDLWNTAAEAINQHTTENSLFLSWWDNNQRIDLLSGRAGWAMLPVVTAFASREEQTLWEKLAGQSNPDDAQLRRLAGWLTMDADKAMAEIAASIPATTPVYLLACLDDLARLSEIERLSGKKLGFEARFFPQSSDMHAQIAQVKHWASEKGNGSYLLQNVPGQGLRAWRIIDQDTENTLLAKILPFTTSIAKPPANLKIVYQSSWGAYLTIYELQR